MNSHDQICLWVEIKGKTVAWIRSVESLHHSLLVFFPPSFFKASFFLFPESESIVFLFIVLFFNRSIHLCLAALGLCCSTRASRGMASLVAHHGL